MAKERELAGNSVGSAVLLAQECARLGEKVMLLEGCLTRLWEDGTYVHSITFRAPRVAGDEYLVVVRGNQDAAAVVAFSSGSTFAESVATLVNRMRNGSLEFKEDRYAKPNSDGK